MSVFEGPKGEPVLKESCRLPEFPMDAAELEQRLVRLPAQSSDPLRRFVEQIPAEILDPARTVAEGIAPGTPTTHGSKTLREFAALKEREKNGTLHKNEAEYFRYGTPATRQLEESLALQHGGESALTFISDQAAKSAVIESLLPVSKEASHFIVAAGADKATRLKLDRLVKRGRVELTEVPREELSDVGRYLKPNTKAVILENVSDAKLGAISVPQVRNAILSGGSTALIVVDQTASVVVDANPLEDGADLLLPAVSRYYSDGTDRVTGVVVGRANLVLPVRDHRSQHGTISHDIDCYGVARGLAVEGFGVEASSCRGSEFPRRDSRHSKALNGTQITARTEKTLGRLDGGEAVVFRSRMAAISAVIDAILPIDGSVAHIIVPEQGYRQTWNILDRLQKQGRVELSVVPMDGFNDIQKLLKPNTAGVFFETPSNPFLRVIDVQEVRNQVDRAGSNALVIVDHTFAGPLNQQPLSQGAHLVVPSLTKYVTGSNQAGAGGVVGHGELIRRVRALRALHGTIAHDADCLRIDQGIATLKERTERNNENGLHVAELLAGHPLVRQLWYPGHPSHPDYSVAQKQMAGYGGVVSFRLGARDFHDIAAFVDAFIAASPEGTYIAPSFGGNTPLVSAVAVVSHFQQTPAERAARGIPDDLMRIALGTQSKESLTKAFEAGFAALAVRQGLN